MLEHDTKTSHNGTSSGTTNETVSWKELGDVAKDFVNDTLTNIARNVLGDDVSNSANTSAVLPGAGNQTSGNGTECCCCEDQKPVAPPKNPKILSDNPGFARMNPWEIYCLLGTISMLAIFSIAANGLVLYTLFKSKSLRRTKNFHFFVLLGVSLANSLIYILYLLLTYASDEDFKFLSCVCQYFYGPSIEVIYNVSMTLMLGMCIERLVSVIRPLWFNSVWVDEKYTIKLIVAMLLLGALPILIPTMGQWIVYKHAKTWMYCRIVFDYDAIQAYYWINIILVYIPCIAGVVFVYIAVQVKATQARKLSMQFREECKKGQSKKEENESGINLESIRKALFASRITILLLILFVATKLPIAVIAYAHYFKVYLPFAVRNCEFSANLTRFFFSVFTPFLFPLLSTPLKNKVVKQLSMSWKSSKYSKSFLDSHSHSQPGLTNTNSTKLPTSTRVVSQTTDTQTLSPQNVV